MAGMVQRHQIEEGRDDGSCCGADRGGLDRYGPCNGFSSVPTRPENMALVSAEVRIGNTETRLEATPVDACSSSLERRAVVVPPFHLVIPNAITHRAPIRGGNM